MSLRARLTAVLALVVVVPALAAVAVIGVALPHRMAAQLRARAVTDLQGDAAVITQACSRATLAAELLARRATAMPSAQAAISLVRDGQAGWAGLIDGSGRVSASAGSQPAGLTERDPGCTQAVGPAGAVVGRATIRGRDAMRVALVAVPAQMVASSLPVGGDRRVVLRSHGQVVATVGQPIVRPVRVQLAAAIGRPLAIEVQVLPASYGGLWAGLGGVGLLVLLVTVLLARRCARLATQPLAALVDAAQRVTAGDLDTVVPVARDDELGRVGAAFNVMTGALRSHLRELEDNRDELRRSVQRLGETLLNTHDADRILGVVLDTALATTGAQSGAVSVEEDGHLHRRVVRGELRDDADASVAVPLGADGRSAGMLELHDKADGTSFCEADLQAVQALAAQAAVAVENVGLHKEAQRLSVTDGLTGLWNRRFLNLALRREVDRALRYEHPLAVLIVDIDRFKSVNDEHGHARGDAVLVDVARRLRKVVRETDVVSRLGGEEFVLVLPETDRAGAARTCERICTAMRGAPFEAADEPPLAVTVSIGAALLPGPGTPPDVLLQAADDALYEVKDGGRDGWRLAPPLAEHIRLEAPTGAPSA